mmetsp:Transcript_684/g.2272  ORF Transcript_684/g.2272 Transcript_684/m.2272 type:complete len:395 (+) Transcript_684:126-1310(+)
MVNKTEVPPVVIETVRMVIRAFYNDNFVVIVDAILRDRNYANDDVLSTRLRLPAKDIRMTLVQLKENRLVKSQKREFQKKIPSNPNRTRKIQKEYWYVDYTGFIDVVKYKIDKIRNEIAERVSEENAQHQLYHCTRCGAEYTALEVIDLLDYSTGRFICDRPLNRRMTCRGELKEEDVASRRAILENLQERFVAELRPIIERINQCDTLDIPLQPSMEQENISPDVSEVEDYTMRGREEGEKSINIEIMDDNDNHDHASAANAAAAAVPDWFIGDKIGGSGPSVAIEDGSAEEEEKPKVATSMTAYLHYADNGADDAHIDLANDTEDNEKTAQEGDQHANEAVTEVPAEEADEPLIAVGDQLIPLSQIGAEHTAGMTMQEYETYKQKYMEKYES